MYDFFLGKCNQVQIPIPKGSITLVRTGFSKQIGCNCFMYNVSVSFKIIRKI